MKGRCSRYASPKMRTGASWSQKRDRGERDPHSRDPDGRTPHNAWITFPTTDSRSSPEHATVRSAYFSYSGTRSSYIPRRLWPGRRTIPRVVMFLSLFAISSYEISRYTTTPPDLRCTIASPLQTTLPPVAITARRG